MQMRAKDLYEERWDGRKIDQRVWKIKETETKGVRNYNEGNKQALITLWIKSPS